MWHYYKKSAQSLLILNQERSTRESIVVRTPGLRIKAMSEFVSSSLKSRQEPQMLVISIIIQCQRAVGR